MFGDYYQNIQLARTNANYVPNFDNVKKIKTFKSHFNIGLPIFIINGNHDNHTADDSFEQISILDILHKSQYVYNYNNLA